MTALPVNDVLAVVEALRRDMQRQIDELKAELAAVTATEIIPGGGISPEILVILAAAVTTYLGKKVRIRSARRVIPSHEISPWAQHGRVFVQAASHELRRVR